jgi:uncharacterized membrane protein YccF (DUF307 family)
MALIKRLVWFGMFGLWIGLFLWIPLGILLSISIIFYPIGSQMLANTWAVMTLSKAPDEVIRDAFHSEENENGDEI